MVRMVRTVLGDVPASSLGPCYSHEHLIIDESYATERHPHLLLPSVDAACTELTELRRLGVRAVVDAMPCAAGRNVRKLAEISRRTGIAVVAPTGFHLPKYYPADHFRHRLGAEALAALFVDELTLGIDAHDHAGPTILRTSHKAGFIKIASAEAPLEDAARPLFEAAALAHRRTGAPIMTHCEAQRGPEQVAALGALGVRADRLVLSHTDRRPDLGYHRALLQSGVRLAYDRPIRGPLDPSHPTVTLATALLPEFPDQLLFATDAARPSYWSCHGGSPGLGFLYTTFAAWLTDAGVDPALVRRAFIDNAAAAFSFTPPVA
jgi:phosphotriesterase-related protein